MFSIAQKKKQALRRLSQSGRKSGAFNSPKSFRGKGIASPTLRQPNKRPSMSDNPFLAALKPSSSSVPADEPEDNVFFKQLKYQQEQQEFEEPITMETSRGVTKPRTQPLSYAAVVKGKHPPTTSQNQTSYFNPFLAAVTRASAPPINQVKDVAKVIPQDPRSAAEPLPSESNCSLHIKGVPDNLNNELYLNQHFSRFGPVLSINCHPEKKFAHVHFKTREAAVLAKSQGRSLAANTPPLTVFWHSQSTEQSKQPQRSSPALKSLSQNPTDHQSEPVKSKGSVFSRLGAVKEPRITAGMKRRQGPYDDDIEYVPKVEDLNEQQDESDDEGVEEGQDSVLAEIQPDDDSKMDTIARVPKHSYYLRSLYQPELSSVPSQSSKECYSLPTLSLPRPPLVKGKTASDYYEALDLRDKEIRKGMTKDTSLRANAKVGCCPDMCPEKERYEREAQRRLSIFEIDVTSEESSPRVDHALAIKEYSRSAADKEEPLPHELRPLSVLTMTMDHIVTCIMDNSDGSWSDWYNFIWDRTRAITTDITYQQLCEPGCATLLEQAARFHILCSHLLCEEEVTVFDSKMNTETIARHLQSLKQLYYDLRQKGTVCPNEAEFCCYDILLHLNDGNVFNKVEQYSDELRSSADVKFAIAVAQSMDNNNFVRFFKLVHKASFLSACLLHRYFNQVRLKALQTFNNSHSPGTGKVMHFSITDLTRMLAFASNNETVEFCCLLNLNVGKGERVQLQRGQEVAPIQPLILRQEELVAMKNTMSLGEVVYGGPLPPRPKHVPHCSFMKTDEEEVLPSPPIINEEDIVAIATEVEDAVLNVEIASVVNDVILKAYECLVKEIMVTTTLNTLLTDVVGVVIKEACEKAYLEALQERHRQEEERLKALLVEHVKDHVVNDVIFSESKMVAKETVEDAMLQKEATECAIQSIISPFVGVVCDQIVIELVKETIQEAKQTRRDKLEKLELQVKQQSFKRYWDRWLKALLLRQHIRRSVFEFPSTGPLAPLANQLDLIMTGAKRRRLDLSLSVEQSLAISTDMLKNNSLLNRQEEDLFAPLDLSLLCASLICHHDNTITVPWNLLLSASPIKYWKDRMTWVWLCHKLSLPSSNEEVVLKYLLKNNTSLKVTVQILSMDSVQEVDLLVIMSSCILFVRLPSPGESPESYSDHVTKLIYTINNKLSSSFVSIPLIILTPLPLDFIYELQLYKEIGSSQFKQVSQVKIVSLVKDNGTLNEIKLKEIITWCVDHTPSLPLVRWIPYKDYISEGLTRHFVKHLLSDCNQREISNLSSQSPGPIVDLYNNVLIYLYEKLETRSATIPVTAISSNIETSPISYWMLPEHDALQSLKHVIKLITLPRPSPIDMQSDWSVQCIACLKYIESISNNVTLLSRIKTLLQDHTHNKGLLDVPWGPIMLIVMEQMNHTLNLCPDDIKIGVPLVDDDDNEHTFILPLCWQEAVTNTLLEASSGSKRKERKRRFSDPIQTTNSKVSRRSLDKLEVVRKKYLKDVSGLQETLKLETSLSDEFDQELKRWTTETDIPTITVKPHPQQHKSHTTNLLEEQVMRIEHQVRCLRWGHKLDRLWLDTSTL